MKRRAFLVGVSVVTIAACAKKARCQSCGMVLDPASPWLTSLVRADGTKVDFDCPKCAFGAWRDDRVQAVDLQTRGYYEHAVRSAKDLRFAIGSDVLGPMGADLVPVEREHDARFGHDHPCRRLDVNEVTMGVLYDEVQ